MPSLVEIGPVVLENKTKCGSGELNRFMVGIFGPQKQGGLGNQKHTYFFWSLSTSTDLLNFIFYKNTLNILSHSLQTGSPYLSVERRLCLLGEASLSFTETVRGISTVL